MAREVNIHIRREHANEHAKRAQAQLKLVEYRIENDDVLILSGLYTGRLVTQLWDVGPNERDYIVKHLAMRNDAAIMKIICKLCGS